MAGAFRYLGILYVCLASLDFYLFSREISTNDLVGFLALDLLFGGILAFVVRRALTKAHDVAPAWWMLHLAFALPPASYDLVATGSALGLDSYDAWLTFAALVVPLGVMMFVDARVRFLNSGPLGPWGRHPAAR